MMSNAEQIKQLRRMLRQQPVHESGRRAFSDEFKAAVLDYIASSSTPVATLAEELGINPPTIYNWRRGEDEQPPQSAAQPDPNGLPTTPRRPAERAREEPAPLVPIAFACPHCGKPVSAP